MSCSIAFEGGNAVQFSAALCLWDRYHVILVCLRFEEARAVSVVVIVKGNAIHMKIMSMESTNMKTRKMEIMKLTI